MSKLLLDLLNGTDALSVAQLADSMDTSTEMIEAQLERYEQLGYVKKTIMYGSSGCDKDCKKCKGCKLEEKEILPVVFWEKI